MKISGSSAMPVPALLMALLACATAILVAG
jgi:hypothetical protein